MIAASAGGRIRMDRISGAVTAKTGGGDIHFGRVDGSVKRLTAGGAMRAGSLGGEAAAPVHASTAPGHIRVSKAASYVDARTAGGLIEVWTAGGPVRAESSSGSIAGAIKPRSGQGALRASTAFGNAFAELPACARLEDSFLHTGFGDIVVLLPSNLAVTIRARNESIGAGRIVSEVPGIRVAGMPLAGSRPAVAQGSLNEGGPLLKLAASGGVIYLRRQK